MNYLADQPNKPDADQAPPTRDSRRRMIAVMLYALPFVLTPLALGSIIIYRSLPTSEQKQLEAQAIERRAQLEHATDLGQLKMMTKQIEQIDARIAQLETHRREYVQERVWASGFAAIGIVLLALWVGILAKIARTRDPKMLQWWPAPPQPDSADASSN